MFFQPPENPKTEVKNNPVKSASALKAARRKRRKRAAKYKSKKQILKIEKQRFANSMSSWAENFTLATTWQLRHQVAHWKSTARALEYENNILRTMLRQYYVKGNAPETLDDTQEPMSAQSESELEEDATNREEDFKEQKGDEKIEISEEFINFLKGNAEFRQKRQERERIRKLESEMPTKLLERCPEAPIDKKGEYRKLYGDRWERIAALEMSIQSKFISECDKDKPIFWPVLPLRL